MINYKRAKFTPPLSQISLQDLNVHNAIIIFCSLTTIVKHGYQALVTDQTQHFVVQNANVIKTHYLHNTNTIKKPSTQEGID